MRRIFVVAFLSAALLAAAACGGGEPATGGGASPSGAGSFPRFAACMREKGQNVPDPDSDGNVEITPPASADRSAWDAAMRSCQQYLPNGGAPDAVDSRQLEALRQYASCMREHGVELTDPDPNTGKSQYGGRFANASRDQIQNDPAVKAAEEACRGVLASAEPPAKGGGGR